MEGVYQLYCLFHQELWFSSLLYMAHMESKSYEFLKCFCLYKLGKFSSISSILESLRKNINTVLPATCLLYIQAKNEEESEVALSLGRELELAESKSTFFGLRVAILCCIHLDEIDLAKQFFTTLTRTSLDKINEVHCTNGWIQLFEGNIQEAEENFVNALSEEQSSLEAEYGRCVCMLKLETYSRTSSLKQLQDLSTQNPEFVAASTLLMVVSPPRFNFVVDMAKKNTDTLREPYALCLRIIHLLAVAGSEGGSLTNTCDDFMGSIMKNKSPDFIVSCLSMIVQFAGLFGDWELSVDATEMVNRLIASYTLAMNLKKTEEICLGYAECCDYAGKYGTSEIVYKQILDDEINENDGQAKPQRASGNNDLSMIAKLEAKIGLARCRIKSGKMEEGAKLLDEASTDKLLLSNTFLGMKVLLFRAYYYEKLGEHDKMLNVCHELLDTTLAFLKGNEDIVYPNVTSIMDYGKRKFPNICGFALSLGMLVGRHVVDESCTIGMPKSYPVEREEDFTDVGSEPELIQRKVIEMLEIVLSSGVPAIGFGMGLLTLSKALETIGRIEGAAKYARALIRLYPNMRSGYLELAGIQLKLNDTEGCVNILEDAINLDFVLRENLLYMRLLAITKLLENDNIQAITYSRLGIEKICDGKEIFLHLIKGKPVSQEICDALLSRINNHELTLLACQISALVLALNSGSSIRDAIAVVKRARGILGSTKIETRFRLVHVGLLLEAGGGSNIKEAQAILDEVDPKKPFYILSRGIAAEIFLNNIGDQEAYLKIFEELARDRPCMLTFVLYGIALQRLQDPMAAIVIYKRALVLDSTHHDIIRRIGNTYVSTHNFELPIEFYERILKENPVVPHIRIEYAKLLLSLEKGQVAVRTLQAGITAGMERKQTVQLLRDRVQMLMLLADAHSMLGEGLFKKESYIEALTAQKEIVSHCSSFPSVVHEEETEAKRAADIAKALADENNGEVRDKYLSEALSLFPQHIPSIVALALLSSMNDDTEGTIRYYRKLMELGHASAEVALELAEKYITKRKDAVQFIEKAAVDISNSRVEDPERIGGLNFCKGKYASYHHDFEDAVNRFGRARMSQRWRIEATLASVEIYLGIAQGFLWEDRMVDPSYVESAETLLATLPMTHKSVKRWASLLKTWHAFTYISKGGDDVTVEIEKSIKALVKVTSSEEVLPALLALSASYNRLGNTSKAKSALRRISKMNIEAGEERFAEYCHLFNAYLHISSGKYEIAKEILKTALTFNGSSVKAYEYLGSIKELEDEPCEAANYFKKAWDITELRNPFIGYKLSKNYTICQKHVESRRVSRLILSRFPHYERYLQPLLDRSEKLLRP